MVLVKDSDRRVASALEGSRADLCPPGEHLWNEPDVDQLRMHMCDDYGAVAHDDRDAGVDQ
jgi:hypothetical protein